MDINTCMTDSLCCTPETNTTVYINYTPLKLNLKEYRAEDMALKGLTKEYMKCLMVPLEVATLLTGPSCRGTCGALRTRVGP